MSWASDFKFSVEPKPNAEVFAPAGGWKEAVPPVSPWTTGAIQQAPPALQAYQTDENLKKAFGIELAKAKNPFEAGCTIFGDETPKALWVSFNWLTDPIVIASRDIYLKTVALSQPPLDREQLAAKLLALAEEKVERNGVMIPTIEAKDRIAALKLYSEVLGFTGKVEIDNSTNKTMINEISIKLVKSEKAPVINNVPNSKSEMSNPNSPITLKLVGGAAR